MSASVINTLVGEWTQVSSENFASFLKAIGVAEEVADKMDDMPSSEKWSVEGDSITLTRSNPKKTVSHTFKLGEESTETTMIGSDAKSKYEVEGDKVVESGSCNGVACTSTRQVIDGALHWEFCTENGTKCVKQYRRI